MRAVIIVAAAAIAACVARDDAPPPGADSTAGPLMAPLGPDTAIFRYGGIGIPDVFDSLAAHYPRSYREGDLIRLDSTESHDHIHAIGFMESGAWKRVSLTFEVHPGLVSRTPPSRRYPRCEATQSTLERSYGVPDSLKRFAEESQLRFDRYWNRGNETLTLICFFAGDTLFAEALTIERNR